MLASRAKASASDLIKKREVFPNPLLLLARLLTSPSQTRTCNPSRRNPMSQKYTEGWDPDNILVTGYILECAS